ncbi:transposase [Cohnella sp. GCM10012308]|uniref:transposase n=1 Tax=Cohnella sp. GCM10012308 TaxID=3317329 RepID=UPI0036201D12
MNRPEEIAPFFFAFKTYKQSLQEGHRQNHYRSANCEDCPLKAACTEAKGNREILFVFLFNKQSDFEKVKDVQPFSSN